MTALALAQQLQSQFADVLSAPSEFRGEITLACARADAIGRVCAHAKKGLGFDLLLDISSVDFHGEEPRFAVVYELYNLKDHAHLRLKVTVPEEHAELPSVVGVWRAADWHEREIYDMMGIRFTGHPDLRRILMWEGYPYHPLRKDFPMTGKPTSIPEVATTDQAPIEGGPFVALPGAPDALSREPRKRGGEETSA